jgi:hypothetical protein
MKWGSFLNQSNFWTDISCTLLAHRICSGHNLNHPDPLDDLFILIESTMASVRGRPACESA